MRRGEVAEGDHQKNKAQLRAGIHGADLISGNGFGEFGCCRPSGARLRKLVHPALTGWANEFRRSAAELVLQMTQCRVYEVSEMWRRVEAVSGI